MDECLRALRLGLFRSLSANEKYRPRYLPLSRVRRIQSGDTGPVGAGHAWPLQRPKSDLAQLFHRELDRVALHTARMSGFFGQVGDIGCGDAVGPQRRNLQTVAEVG